MVWKVRYCYFGVWSRCYCYGVSLCLLLIRFGKMFGVGGMIVYKIGRGELWKFWIFGFNGRIYKCLCMLWIFKVIVYFD